MSEKFNNYLVKTTLTSGNNSETILIPTAGSPLPNSYGSGTRPSNSVSQIHSIYITKEKNGVSTNPEAESTIVSLAIKTGTTSQAYKIADHVQVLPNSSFYIEKTITLLPHQTLVLINGNNTSNSVVNVVCSTVDITE